MMRLTSSGLRRHRLGQKLSINEILKIWKKQNRKELLNSIFCWILTFSSKIYLTVVSNDKNHARSIQTISHPYRGLIHSVPWFHFDGLFNNEQLFFAKSLYYKPARRPLSNTDFFFLNRISCYTYRIWWALHQSKEPSRALSTGAKLIKIRLMKRRAWHTNYFPELIFFSGWWVLYMFDILGIKIFHESSKFNINTNR